MPPSIVLIGLWFGPWPPWIDFFLISCRANPTIDWLIFTDQTAPDSAPGNVKVVTSSFEDYRSLLNRRLSIRVHDAITPYKLCDFRPALGYVHEQEIRAYDFFGFTDFDVIYGEIRWIYDQTTLAFYDALATHAMHISGHLFLMRNTREMRRAFKTIPDWRSLLQAQQHVNFDEQKFSSFFFNGRRRSPRLFGFPRRRPYLFKEAFSTPMPTTDMRWYWKDGRLSNEFYPQRSFLYLHFMVWHSSKFYYLMPNVTRGAPAPWRALDEIVQIDWRRAQEEGFMISPAGIQAIEMRPYP